MTLLAFLPHAKNVNKKSDGAFMDTIADASAVLNDLMADAANSGMSLGDDFAEYLLSSYGNVTRCSRKRSLMMEGGVY